MILSEGITSVKAFALSEQNGAALVEWRSIYEDKLHQVYVNGKLIGSTGEFGKRIWSTNSYNWDKYWAELRGYEIPEGLLKLGGKNYVAVRVFDHGGEGGIYNGPIGILSYKEYKKYKSNHEHYSNSNFYFSTRHIVINTFKN